VGAASPVITRIRGARLLAGLDSARCFFGGIGDYVCDDTNGV
jgi:hypothetical protein